MIYVVQCSLLAAARAQRGSQQKQGAGAHQDNGQPRTRRSLSKKRNKLLGFDGYLVLYDEPFQCRKIGAMLSARCLDSQRDLHHSAGNQQQNKSPLAMHGVWQMSKPWVSRQA